MIWLDGSQKYFQPCRTQSNKRCKNINDNGSWKNAYYHMMIMIYFLTYSVNYKESACKNWKYNRKQHHF